MYIYLADFLGIQKSAGCYFFGIGVLGGSTGGSGNACSAGLHRNGRYGVVLCRHGIILATVGIEIGLLL